MVCGRSGVRAASAANAGARGDAYPERLKQSWIWDELYRVRNIRPSFRLGLWGGLAYSALDTFVFRGKAPWTFHNHADHTQLQQASQAAADRSIRKPDGKIIFDRLSSVFISNTNHEEDQPSHLTLRTPTMPIAVNYRDVRRAGTALLSGRACTRS